MFAFDMLGALSWVAGAHPTLGSRWIYCIVGYCEGNYIDSDELRNSESSMKITCQESGEAYFACGLLAAQAKKARVIAMPVATGNTCNSDSD